MKFRTCLCFSLVVDEITDTKFTFTAPVLDFVEVFKKRGPLAPSQSIVNGNASDMPLNIT
eukprot:SAG31_NODE_398_length_16250_cov_8.737601_12_plen_60_part_00